VPTYPAILDLMKQGKRVRVYYRCHKTCACWMSEGARAACACSCAYEVSMFAIATPVGSQPAPKCGVCGNPTAYVGFRLVTMDDLFGVGDESDLTKERAK
jgi:hypothetical protein